MIDGCFFVPKVPAMMLTGMREISFILKPGCFPSLLLRLAVSSKSTNYSLDIPLCLGQNSSVYYAISIAFASHLHGACRSRNCRDWLTTSSSNGESAESEGRPIWRRRQQFCAVHCALCALLPAAFSALGLGFCWATKPSGHLPSLLSVSGPYFDSGLAPTSLNESGHCFGSWNRRPLASRGLEMGSEYKFIMKKHITRMLSTKTVRRTTEMRKQTRRTRRRAGRRTPRRGRRT